MSRPEVYIVQLFRRGGGEEIKPVPCSKIGNKTCTWCFFTNFDAKIRHFEHFGKIIWSPHGKLQGKAPNPNPNPKTSICTVKQTAVTVQLAAACTSIKNDWLKTSICLLLGVEGAEDLEGKTRTIWRICRDVRKCSQFTSAIF